MLALRESLPVALDVAASHGLDTLVSVTEAVVVVHGLGMGIGVVLEGGDRDGVSELGTVGSGVSVSVGESFDSEDFNVLETSENSGKGCIRAINQ